MSVDVHCIIISIYRHIYSLEESAPSYPKPITKSQTFHLPTKRRMKKIKVYVVCLSCIVLVCIGIQAYRQHQRHVYVTVGSLFTFSVSELPCPMKSRPKEGRTKNRTFKLSFGIGCWWWHDAGKRKRIDWRIIWKWFSYRLFACCFIMLNIFAQFLFETFCRW